MTKPTPSEPRTIIFTGPARDALGIAMLCAWNGVDAPPAGADWGSHANDYTREAWARVAEAAIKHSPPILPAWVDDFLNRRNDVERTLRGWARKGYVPTPVELTEIANKLSVPAEFEKLP